MSIRGPKIVELPSTIECMSDAYRAAAQLDGYPVDALERLLQAIAERCRPAGIKVRMQIALTHIDEEAVNQAANDNDRNVVRTSTGAVGLTGPRTEANYPRPMGTPRVD